jgi:hypothetical protein
MMTRPTRRNLLRSKDPDCVDERGLVGTDQAADLRPPYLRLL